MFRTLAMEKKSASEGVTVCTRCQFRLWRTAEGARVRSGDSGVLKDKWSFKPSDLPRSYPR